MNSFFSIQRKTIVLLCCLFCVGSGWAQEVYCAGIKNVKLSGYLGEKIDACIAGRVKTQDVDHLIEPFKTQTETRLWQTEFWGKWILGAIGSYHYTKDSELYNLISYAAKELMSTQLPNGYIGNYSPEAQLEQWDVWGRKYTLLGLLAYYDLTQDKKALEAACKLGDHLLTQLGPDHRNIVKTGNYHGMPSSSILEPVMYLYNHTQESRYLDFARYIVEQWETPDGPQLISKAVKEVPVAERFPFPEQWWSWENGQKAYEMMSCYVGLLELYKVIPNPLYLYAVEKTVTGIIAQEINVAGSGSAFECWYGGKAKQTYPTYHTMETCVTFTWMQLCNRMLQLTGNSLYADEIEKSAYNALMASLKEDASQIAKYSPLEGCRHEGEEQCGMHINCCNANGPRAFAMLPQVAYQVQDDCIKVNLYTPSEVLISLDKNKSVQLIQETDYPMANQTKITVNPQKEAVFTLALRIPAWSEKTEIKINGEAFKVPIEKGSYCLIKRKWKKEDKVLLTLDLRSKVIKQNHMQAIVRGPVVLARDSRFADGDVDETSVIVQKDGYVELNAVQEKSGFAWMEFTAPLILGTDLEGNHVPRLIRFCDFASAGNTWDKKQRYRVWLPETLNVMQMPYKRY